MQVLNEEEEGLILHCTQEGPESSEVLSVSKQIDALLQEFHEVFSDPRGLPPSRNHDHAIHLKEGAEIPNMRPYKYPHYQKTEIERLVLKMLELGVIRHNISPYSSPIILVKKKDGVA